MGTWRGCTGGVTRDCGGEERWEYSVTERVPDAGDTLVRAGVTWIVVGVTEAVDDHRVVTMALPPPEDQGFPERGDESDITRSRRPSHTRSR